MHTKTKPLVTTILCLLFTLELVGCGSSNGASYFDACDGALSAEECYALRRDPDSEQIALATDIALRYIEEHPASTELFDWTSGVFMFALTELYRVTGDTRLRDYYQEYLDYHIEQGYEITWSDSCPPALTALALLTETESAPYRQVVGDVLDYLRTVPRTEEGGITHLGPALADAFGPAIWIDSLFMFGMVLNRHGESADDADALALMSQQLGVFSEVLQHESGLMVHADDWILEFDTDIYWARGNSWVTATLADYLRIRRLRGESDAGAERMFRSHVEGALATQDAASGLWWTVTNRPAEDANYLETSAAALFAYGMARGYRYGLLGQDALAAAKRAMEAVRGAVDTDEEGRSFVTGISGGTEPSTFEGYIAVPVSEDLNYGVGATILGLVETSGL
jgi:unsaturated rhamnogalacturonyl hydrolase